MEQDAVPAGKGRCNVCERVVSRWKFTVYLHAHKMPRDKHDQLWPDQPYLDGWCPGGRHTTR